MLEDSSSISDHFFSERQPGKLGHQPAAQGPSTIVFTADRQNGFSHTVSKRFVN
jgi:hypothetical protein